jgi:hypothetical protein
MGFQPREDLAFGRSICLDVIMKRNRAVTAAAASIAASLIVALPHIASADGLPAVRTGAANTVPECVTPGRMMALIGARNAKLDARFRGIATSYMRHGEQMGVRWDYAVYQMILETGSLAYQRGNGKPGDVKPSQNNFAGLGATGKGEPGEKFASVDDGVKAHLQHLLMYSGEVVEEPVAERTRNVQQWGILTSWQKGFKRPITFADVAGKWAPGSRGYVGDLKSISDQFNDAFCNKADPNPGLVQEARAGRVVAMKTARVAKDATQEPDYARQAMERAREDGDTKRSSLGAKAVAVAVPAKTEPAKASGGPALKVLNEAAAEAPIAEEKPVQVAAATASAKPPVVKGGAAALATTVAVSPKPPVAPQPSQAGKCRVFTASYGGQKAVIIRASSDSFTNFTVLDVNDGQEAREVEAYIAAYAKGGQSVGQFTTSNSALEEAFKLCPEG